MYLFFLTLLVLVQIQWHRGIGGDPEGRQAMFLVMTVLPVTKRYSTFIT
jgi:hypothetical protein